MFVSAQVFTEYFKELEEESIQDNFVVVYELLDELMDFGFPQTTDSKILQEGDSPRRTMTHNQTHGHDHILIKSVVLNHSRPSPSPLIPSLADTLLRKVPSLRWQRPRCRPPSPMLSPGGQRASNIRRTRSLLMSSNPSMCWWAGFLSSVMIASITIRFINYRNYFQGALTIDHTEIGAERLIVLLCGNITFI